MTQPAPSLGAFDLDAWIGHFYADPRELGELTPAAADDLPHFARRLLDHHEHMTVTLEDVHGCGVDLHVLESGETAESYTRKIVLTRRRDGAAVLFGLVRLATRFLPPQVLHEIRAQQMPLGSILIQHDVMRQVQRLQLWRIAPGTELRRRLPSPGATLFGRTALILCNGEPAIELLEILCDHGGDAPDTLQPRKGRFIPA